MQNLVSATVPTVADEINMAAKAQMARGLAGLEKCTPESLQLAVECFDQAIALRSSLPLAANPWFRYGLIAGWLNRGDALTRQGDARAQAEALRSFDEALGQLRELPMHESPLFVRRLAVAWLNRGVALLAHDTPQTAALAADNFTEAIAAARNYARLAPADGAALLAAAWMNRGNALIRLDPPCPHEAQAAASQALSLVAGQQTTEIYAAEIAFKSSHVLCQSLALIISTTATDDAAREAGWHEATDAVEAGLALARHWQARGERRFDAATAELFRFGCRAYQMHQPHFLTEFLLEHLDPSRSETAFAASLALHASAAESLWRALGVQHRQCFKSLNTEGFAPALELFRELRVTDERLAELRRQINNAQPALR